MCSMTHKYVRLHNNNNNNNPRSTELTVTGYILECMRGSPSGPCTATYSGLLCLGYVHNYYNSSNSYFILHQGWKGTRYRSWLRHYATNRKVVGSIPDEVIGFFNWPNPSSSTMTLGSSQLLTEMSSRNLPGGKGRSARKGDNLTAICEPIV
jgi:hypothetical protein